LGTSLVVMLVEVSSVARRVVEKALLELSAPGLPAEAFFFF